MRYKRIFVNDVLNDGACIRLDRETSHYLINVLRCRTGEKLEVFNGTGGSYTAEVVTAHKRETVIQLDGFLPEESSAELTTDPYIGGL